MLGWEFPPYSVGGIGTACYELTKSMNSIFDDLNITYIMPFGPENRVLNKNLTIQKAKNLKVEVSQTVESEKVFNENFKIKKVDSFLSQYDDVSSYKKRLKFFKKNRIEVEQGNVNLSKDNITLGMYGNNLLDEVDLFSRKIVQGCSEYDFDVIHSHDWTTFLAGVELKKSTGKPLVLHTHITEFNKSGGKGVNKEVYELERYGFMNADKVICVSEQIKNILIREYGIESSKLVVIHNGGISDLKRESIQKFKKDKTKIVLYAGRVTTQKGPEFFIKAVKRVLELEDNVKFILAGDGDMLNEVIELSKELGVFEKVYFWGRYSREDADFLYKTADVFIMPSVLEPFGIVPLEAIAKSTPTIISKQSGISEVLEHTFKVDFWDVDDIADKILALLEYEHLNFEITNKAYYNLDKFSWDIVARKVLKVYEQLIVS